MLSAQLEDLEYELSRREAKLDDLHQVGSTKRLESWLRRWLYSWLLARAWLYSSTPVLLCSWLARLILWAGRVLWLRRWLQRSRHIRSEKMTSPLAAH